MCGIAGFNYRDEKEVRHMTATLAHRGPDARGIFTDEHISLGHTRLSVIDLSSAANQPMHDTEDRYVIVFNGEIYNFRALRREMDNRYAFRTQSDTEVILAGYHLYGAGFVERLNGMFAFAIWDRKKKTLFCARDRAGIKPFYYFWDGNRFIFASEIKGIFSHNDVPRVLNTESMNDYMRVLYTPEPHTLVNQVYKLPPGYALDLRGASLKTFSYISVRDQDLDREMEDISYSDAVNMLRGKVGEAVERQLVADVPVGIYLSGGIDSSAVLAAMAEKHTAINTFSVGFSLSEVEEEEKFNRDMKLARATAEYFGTRHHELFVSAQDVREHFENMIVHADDPVSNPTAVPMMLLAKKAKERVSVVLTGSGGDELFGGYERYRIALAAAYYRMVPHPIQKILSLHPELRKLGYRDSIELFARFMFEKDVRLSRVVASSVLYPEDRVRMQWKERYPFSGARDIADVLMDIDRRSWLPDFFFTLSDKMSMAHALEERVPLIDNELISFAASLPRPYKVNIFGTKKILKDAFRQKIPDVLFDQPKRGWFSPGAKWLRDEAMRSFAREVLSKGYYRETSSLFAWNGVHDMLEKHLRREEYNLTILWAMLTFQVWARTYQIRISHD